MEARPDLAGLFRLPALAPCGRSAPHMFFWGTFLIITSVLSFLAFFYAAVMSKVLPASGIPLLTAIEKDWYYCLLVPLTAPVVIIAVYFHWLSMKLFKHA